MADVIQRLRELRQSSSSSVVTGIETTSSEDRPVISHPVENWLIELILDQLTAPQGPSISLIVLSGNAGDGKSYLLREIRQRLVNEDGLDPAMISWLLDATESSHQAQRAVDRLDEFFASFADTADWDESTLHVVAMNTGTVVRFMAHDQGRGQYRSLCDILGLQLAIRGAPEVVDNNGYWDRFDRILVIDLDRRTLISLEDEVDGFFDQMIASLDRTSESSHLAEASTECSSCQHSDSCPVNANLVALQDPTVRRRLNTLLRDVTLEDRIHLGPRSLWHLIYQITVGGLDVESVARQKPLVSCADIAAIDESARTRALFYTALFDESAASGDAGGGALLSELARVDPYRRFTLDAHDSALAAGLSFKEDLRLAERLAVELGLPPEALAGHFDDPASRAVSAVRRSYFLERSDPNPRMHAWLRDWAGYLRDHGREVSEGRATRHEIVNLLISVLTDLYGVQGQRGLWHLPLPWRNQAHLFVQLSLRPGPREQAIDPRVLGPDAYRQGGLREVTIQLAEQLDAHPLSISVPLRDGPDVRVTWPLYRLLLRVSEERYIAASLDPERIQNLERIGASLGAQAGLRDGVAVLTGGGGLVCEDDGDGGYDVTSI